MRFVYIPCAFQILIGFLSNFIVLPPTTLIIAMFRNGGWFTKRTNRIDKTIEKITKDGFINWETKKHQRNPSNENKSPWPAIVIIIAWLLSFLCILGGTFFIVALGLNFGNDKTYQWVTAMVSAIFASLLITQPLLVTTYYFLNRKKDI